MPLPKKLLALLLALCLGLALATPAFAQENALAVQSVSGYDDEDELVDGPGALPPPFALIQFLWELLFGEEAPQWALTFLGYPLWVVWMAVVLLFSPIVIVFDLLMIGAGLLSSLLQFIIELFL